MPPANAPSTRMVMTVMCQFSQNSTPTPMSAVTSPPTSCTSPVPTRLRMPSASVITREMRTPVCVESKKRTGRRAMCACTLLRISVMARCAATPRTCESVNEVTACTTVAPPATSAMVASRSARCLPMTSSIRYFELAGSTSPASRLTSISVMPSASRDRCAQISSRASRHACESVSFFFFSSAIRRVEARPASSTPRLPDEFADLAPGDEPDVVLFEQAAEGLGRDEVEVALPPRRAPAGVAERDGAHLLVVVGEVDDELRDAGAQALYQVGVVLGPALGRDRGVDVYQAVYGDAVGAERG